MKKELVKFIEKETGYAEHSIINAVKKYFKGKEVEWQNKQMYIGETHTLSCENGELYLSGDFGELVWNCETLFTDLPFIIKLVLDARAETDKRVKENIEELTRLCPNYKDERPKSVYTV